MLRVNVERIPESILIARKIASLRRSCGYTQREFARCLGLSHSYLAKLETGVAVTGICLETLLGILEKLQISTQDFFSYDRDDYLKTAAFLQRRESKYDSVYTIPLDHVVVAEQCHGYNVSTHCNYCHNISCMPTRTALPRIF